MRQGIRSGIFRKIILSILAVSLVPLIILSGLALRSITEASVSSIDRSREALDAKSTEALELRAVETANAVARFLEDRETELRTFALLSRTDESYLSFSKVHQGEIWLYGGARQMIPLYKELTYVDANGQEMIKIVDDQVAPLDMLRDVSDPANTTYRSETYFADTRQLSPGKVYVSHVTGYYVSKSEFEEGKRFRGIVRFAMPVYAQDEQFDGIVVLALDSRHLEKFTEHIVPTSERFAAAPDPATGNYAYMIDDRAGTIAHPNDYLQWGLGLDGQPLPYATRPEEIGALPVRLDKLGFMDENLASIPARTARGEAGSIQYYWAGHNKFAAYAPISYYGGDYAPPAGFGWVGISADVNTFHEAAMLVDEAIQGKTQSLVMLSLVVLAITVFFVLAIGGVLARQISAPIQRVTEAAYLVERGDFQLGVLDPLITGQSEDEIVRLARIFKGMAEQVYKREQLLKQQVHELRIEVDEARKVREVAEITETEYFQELQRKAAQLRDRLKKA